MRCRNPSSNPFYSMNHGVVEGASYNGILLFSDTEEKEVRLLPRLPFRETAVKNLFGCPLTNRIGFATVMMCGGWSPTESVKERVL